MDGISALRKKLFQLLDSEWKLSHCSNIDEVYQLIRRDSEMNKNLVKEWWSETAKLICFFLNNYH